MPFIEYHTTEAIRKFKAGLALWRNRRRGEGETGLWRACSENNLVGSFNSEKKQNHEKQPANATVQRTVKVQHVSSPSRGDRPVTPVKSSLRRRTTDPEREPSKAKPKRVTFSLYALILSAASQNLVSELAYLLDMEPSYINKPSSSGETALHKAANKGHLDCIKLLVQRGANVNLPDKQGITPLFTAWEKEHLECHKYMLSSLRQGSWQQRGLN